jgi:hypothetical protein
MPTQLSYLRTQRRFTLAVSFADTFTSIVKRDFRSSNVVMCIFFEPPIKSLIFHVSGTSADGDTINDLPLRLASHIRALCPPHHAPGSEMSN